MKRFSSWLTARSTTWMMVGTALIMVGFLVFVLPRQSEAAGEISGEAGSPDLSFSYSPEALYQMAGAYGLEGRQAYIQARWSFDLIFPLVYTAFLVLGISWFNQRLPRWPEGWKLTNLVPLLAGICDLLENSASSLAMAIYPQRVQAVLLTASIATPVKWVLVSASFLLYFIFGVGSLIEKIRNKLKNQTA